MPTFSFLEDLHELAETRLMQLQAFEERLNFEPRALNAPITLISPKPLSEAEEWALREKRFSEQHELHVLCLAEIKPGTYWRR